MLFLLDLQHLAESVPDYLFSNKALNLWISLKNWTKRWNLRMKRKLFSAVVVECCAAENRHIVSTVQRISPDFCTFKFTYFLTIFGSGGVKRDLL